MTRLKRRPAVAAMLLVVAAMLLAAGLVAYGVRPVATTPAPPVRAVAVEPLVYVTRTGRRYHRGGCSALLRSRIAMPLSLAIRRGYTPCRLCSPPEG